MTEDQKIEAVEIVEENVRITLLIPKDKILERDPIGYTAQTEITNKISRLIAEDILEKNKKEIIEKVLNGVNWPDVVRSEVAQKVIKEIAKSY